MSAKVFNRLLHMRVPMIIGDISIDYGHNRYELYRMYDYNIYTYVGAYTAKRGLIEGLKKWNIVLR